MTIKHSNNIYVHIYVFYLYIYIHICPHLNYSLHKNDTVVWVVAKHTLVLRVVVRIFTEQLNVSHVCCEALEKILKSRSGQRAQR